MSKASTASDGLGFGGALFLLFLGLKLCHVIDWSWWWVTAPLWAPLGVAVALLAMYAVFVGAIALFAARKGW